MRGQEHRSSVPEQWPLTLCVMGSRLLARWKCIREGRRQRRGAGLVGLKTPNVADVMTRLKTGTPAEVAGVP